MNVLNLFRRAAPAVEKRAAGSGFTGEVMRLREAYIQGRTGLAELTGTVSACVAHWQNGFALAEVNGTDMLTPSMLSMIGRSLALRGEFVALIDGDTLVPASDWDTRTRNSQPIAYRLSIPESGGGRSMTALAGEVIHVRINVDNAAPWLGVSPLRTASLSAGMLHSVETALSEVFASAPLGSQVVPMPESNENSNNEIAASFVGRRGRVLLRESVAVTAAGGPQPMQDWRPSDLTPNLSQSTAGETMAAARESIALAYGILPALLHNRATGQLIKAGEQHLAQWALQPLANLIAEEAGAKLGGEVTIDVMQGTQAFDTGAAARSFQMLIVGLAQAKAEGIDPAAALAMLDWAKPKETV